MDLHPEGHSYNAPPRLGEENQYQDNEQQPTGADRSEQTRSVVEVGKICTRLGILFDHTPHPHMRNTLVPLLDGQDQEGNT